MTSEEKAREAVLAWITKAESLLNSATLLEITRPGGRIEPEITKALLSRFSRLVTEWDRKFPKYAPLMGLARADGVEVGHAFDTLNVTIYAVESEYGEATCVAVEEASEVCLAALAKLSKKVAVAEDRPPPDRDWQLGRPTAIRISNEVLVERAESGNTLPTIGAEAKAIAKELRSQFNSGLIDIRPPVSRTVEDHIREGFNALKS